MAVCLLRQPLCLLWATEQEDGMILSTDSPFQHQPGPFLPRADLPFLCLKPWPTGHETSSSISPGAWLHQRGGHPRCWWKGLIARMGKRSYSGNDFLINTHWKQLIFSWWFYFLPGRDSYFDCVYKAPTAALADRASHWWLDLAHFSPGSDYLRVGTTNPTSPVSTAASLLPCPAAFPAMMTITKTAITIANTYIRVSYIQGTFLSTIPILTHLILTYNLLYNLKESGNRKLLVRAEIGLAVRW